MTILKSGFDPTKATGNATGAFTNYTFVIYVITQVQEWHQTGTIALDQLDIAVLAGVVIFIMSLIKDLIKHNHPAIIESIESAGDVARSAMGGGEVSAQATVTVTPSTVGPTGTTTDSTPTKLPEN